MQLFGWLAPNLYCTWHSARSSSERGEGDQTTYRVELVELMAERVMIGVRLLGEVGGLLSGGFSLSD